MNSLTGINQLRDSLVSVKTSEVLNLTKNSSLISPDEEKDLNQKKPGVLRD